MTSRAAIQTPPFLSLLYESQYKMAWEPKKPASVRQAAKLEGQVEELTASNRQLREACSRLQARQSSVQQQSSHTLDKLLAQVHSYKALLNGPDPLPWQ